MSQEPVQRRLQFIMEHYGLRPNQNITLNYFGMANEVFTIPTLTGKFVLKHCFKNNTRALVENETALIRHLNEKGVPTPSLVPTKNGQPFLEHEGEFYIMTEYVDGYFPTWEDDLSLDMIQQSTTALADFHRAVLDFKAPNATNRIGILDISPARDWVTQLLNDIDHLDDTVTAKRKSISRIQTIGKQLIELADELESALAQFDQQDLQRLWVHGDMHCFNLIFNEAKDHYTGVLDFDFLREDVRLFDIYWTSRIYNWSFWFKEEFGDKVHDDSFEPPEVDTKRIIQHNLKVMIETYHRNNPITGNELRHLPLMAKAMPLFVVRFFNLNNSEDECLEHCGWFEWKLKTLDFIHDAVDSAIKNILLTHDV